MTPKSSNSTIDQIEAHCDARGVKSARHSTNELWLFTEGETPRGKRWFIHRFHHESQKLFSVQSGVTLPAGTSASKATKLATKKMATLTAADSNFKYPAMTLLFRGAADELTDDLIERIIDTAVENAGYIVALVHWRHLSQKQSRVPAERTKPKLSGPKSRTK